MSEQTTVLGKKLRAGEGRRDAIHIACVPLIAEHDMMAGRPFGVKADGKTAIGHPPYVGIVDPFLVEMVKAGEHFWGLLFPNTITGLRHEWTHPAFPAVDTRQESTTISHDEHKAKSVVWMKAHARKLGLTPDVVMEDAETWLEYGDYTVQQGTERWRNNFEPVEFWHHYEVLTGKIVPSDKKQSFYCCTC